MKMEITNQKEAPIMKRSQTRGVILFLVSVECDALFTVSVSGAIGLGTNTIRFESGY
jgi:hypothetical protein